MSNRVLLKNKKVKKTGAFMAHDMNSYQN